MESLEERLLKESKERKLTRVEWCYLDEHYAESWEDDMKQEAPFE